MLLAPSFLDELRSRTLLSGVIGRTLKLQKAGREFKACCPFHSEKTPSFYVNDEKEFYHCFGCGAHGDVIRFLTDARGLGFMDAVRELADQAGMSLPKADAITLERAERASGLSEIVEQASSWFGEQLGSASGLAARAYLDKRGIAAETQRQFGLGFAPDSRTALKNAMSRFTNELLVEAGLLVQIDEEGREPYDRFRGRLIIPIRDARGRAIAFGGRILGTGEPKYLNSPETPLFSKGSTLFNLDKAAPAAREAQRILVVEGFLDVIALYQAGIREAVAPLGTALTEAQMARLWKLSDIPILCFDGDSAGRKAAVRAAIRALPLIEPGRTLRFALLPEGQDPDDLIKSEGIEAFEKVVSEAISLDELLWQHELAESQALVTPEDRAGLGKRLRDHTQDIRDDFLRKQYLAEFNRRVFELFSFKNLARFGRAIKKREDRPIPPELRKVAEFGIDQAVIAPAVIRGLIRFPNLVAEYAEAIASLIIRDKQLKQVQRILLEAALAIPEVDAMALEMVLHEEGLGGFLEALKRSKKIAFSFLTSKADPREAEKDLIAVIAHLVAVFHLRRELARLVRQIPESDGDAAFSRLSELRHEEQRIMEEFSDLRLEQSEEAS